MKLTRFLTVCVLSAATVCAADEKSSPRQAPAVRIRSLLASRCLECHSGAKPKGGLDLSRKEGWAKGGESGPAVTAGKPNASLAWKRVSENEMPPKQPLTKEEKTLLERWIRDGAKWQGGPIDRFKLTTEARAGYDWWALRRLQKIEPPKTANRTWVRNGIDQFVLHRLAERSLQPSPPASARALIRRLYVDLTGLPPTLTEVQAFVHDPSEAHYLKIVDRLLDSPHYGERWGRHWLDVVRFGESDGFERNNPRKNSWHYRDWVIKSLNADMPYDEFVRLQLAGDLLKPGPDGSAAVGFLVAGVHNTVVGGSKRMKLLARQDELEEIVGAVGQTFLGLTVNCARCHDHKFDPIRTSEYYQMIAALDGVQHGERTVHRQDNTNRITAAQKNLNTVQDTLAKLDTAARNRIIAERKKKGSSKVKPEAPRPYAQWEFEGNFHDSIGKLHGKPNGGARIESGALVLNGRDAFVQTAPLDKRLEEKTLEAWVVLGTLDQRGGAPISVETQGGAVFDAIVYGEREERQWMAGSDGFRRTKSFSAPQETIGNRQPVHFAIVYRKDGTITGYRNGQPYGKPYKTGFRPFEVGKAHVVFGMRHAPAGSNKMLSGKVLRASLYDRALSPEAVAASAGVESNFVSEKSLLAAMTPAQREVRKQLANKRDELLAKISKLQNAAQTKMYTVIARNPAVMRVHIRGSVTDYGAEVRPGGVAAVPGSSADLGLSKNAPDAERRKRLASWVTHKNNDLFVRVIVNRIWHYHFGAGIVQTPSDLGFNGGRPSHPHLLDWLSQKFKDDGFRLKSLHRRIVTSATYRQSSQPNAAALKLDAQNRLLWRYAPRRIEAEVLRDSMLRVAGLLNPQQGGPGFEDVRITPNNGTTYYSPYDPVGSVFHRRTIYRFTPRGGRSAVLDTFDCPDPSSAAPRRSVTTTPLQALSLLNNAFVLRMADEFAKRVEQAEKTPEKQVTIAWQAALARTPDKEEKSLAVQLVKEHGLSALCRALFNCNEFVIIE